MALPLPCPLNVTTLQECISTFLESACLAHVSCAIDGRPSADLQEGLPHHATMREVAIHISNHTMHKFDRGVVVVGASTDLGDLASRAAGSAVLLVPLPANLDLMTTVLLLQ